MYRGESNGKYYFKRSTSSPSPKKCIYKNILNSTVSIEINPNSSTISVKDNDCALCKYHFEDIEVAGCEIIASMIAEFVNLINAQSGTSLSLEPINIKESRALGNKSCIHVYKYLEGGM